ncbi:CHAP domain-containing protein [bacterium A37T11]|nr:CHAP domain-containing protein [bacterium A37T11]
MGGGVGRDGISRRSKVEAGKAGMRVKLQQIYSKEIGVHEATGHNDGKSVEEYLRYCGVGKGNNWCSAFICWCLGQAGIANPKNPWAPAMFPAKRLVTTPLKGTIFGLYFPELKRIGHCGFVDTCDGKWITTVEGNSGNAVVRKRRLVSTIDRVADWVD